MVAPPASSTPVPQLTERVKAWFGVTLAPHPDRAVAFRLDDATIGVLHHDGLLEVPLPPPIRTVLVEEEMARAHAARAGSDWVARPVRADADVPAAVLLLRLSYLYRRLLRSQDAAAHRRIRIELREYGLPDALEALYERMLAKRNPGSSALPGAPPAGT
jgi:hypothetical protein